MDAYAPIAPSVAPYAFHSTVDEPWLLRASTVTMWWGEQRLPEAQARLSSTGPALTLQILDNPHAAGLERLRTFQAWGDNWDAEGGRAPERETLDAASQIFSLLAVSAVPQVALSSDGSPMFVYSGAGGLRGEVTVTSPHTYDYFFLGEGAPSDEDVPFNGGALAGELIAYLRANAAE